MSTSSDDKLLSKYGLGSIKFMAATAPVFVEKQGKDWVYFGAQNDYPSYLIELKRRSVLHSTILDKKCRLIYGDGWTYDKRGLSALDSSLLNEWIKDPNGDDCLNETTKKIIADLECFDGVYIQVIYDKGQRKKKKLVHVPFEYVRRNKDCTKFYYTKHWFKTSSDGKRRMNPQPDEADDFKVFTPYDPEKKNEGSQIYFYDCYSIGKDVYPLPNYLAGITAIETEARIDNFWLNFIKKGFSVAHMINFYNGIPTPEEQDKLEKRINDKFAGDDGDTTLINFAQDREHGSEVLPLAPSDFDKQFQLLKTTTQTSILQIHAVSNGAMLGIKTEGQLGGRDEVIDAIEEFQNMYITTRQNIVEYIFDTLLADEGAKGRMELKQLQPLGMKYSEDFIRAVIPQEALAKMVAEKLGIDLSIYKNSPVATQTTQVTQNKFSEEGFEMPLGIVDVFSKYGRLKSEFKEKTSREFEFTNDEDLEASELLFKQSFADEKKSVNTIGLPESQVETPPTGTPKAQLEVVYSYGGPEDSKNRPFCAKMMSLGRYYTKQDMNAINSEINANDEYRAAFGGLDINVWKHRGGWYRKPGSDVSRANCRHKWYQSLVVKE